MEVQARQQADGAGQAPAPKVTRPLPEGVAAAQTEVTKQMQLQMLKTQMANMPREAQENLILKYKSLKGLGAAGGGEPQGSLLHRRRQTTFFAFL